MRSDLKLIAGSRKNHSGSGQLQIQNEFEEKLLWKTDKNLTIYNRNAQFEMINFFYQKIFPKKFKCYISS